MNLREFAVSGSGRLVRNVLWPTLKEWADPPSQADEATTKQEIDAILGQSWEKAPEVALKKAQEVGEYEEERRRTAEGKSSTCLLVVGALVPFLTFFESAILQNLDSSTPKWLAGAILLLGAAYLVASGLWALRTIAVGNYAVIGTRDMVRIWAGARDVREQLIVETLVAVRCNQEQINRKVSAYKMANEFLYRAVFAFGLLLVIQVCFNIYESLN